MTDAAHEPPTAPHPWCPFTRQEWTLMTEALRVELAGLRTEIANLRTDVTSSRTEIRDDVIDLHSRVAAVETKVAVLESAQTRQDDRSKSNYAAVLSAVVAVVILVFEVFVRK